MICDLGEVIISFSGGPRDYLVPLITVSIFHAHDIKKIYMRSDIDNSLDELDMPQMSARLQDYEEQIIQLLTDSSNRSIGDISSELGVSQSTVSRRVKRMQQRDLVKVNREEKKKIVEASLKAKMLL